MHYKELIGTVSNRAGIPSEQAERATRATLQTLAERLPEPEGHGLAAYLPAELADVARVRHSGQGFDVQEFRRRVAERERVTLPEAEQHARAVLATLGSAVAPAALEAALQTLPEEYREPLAAGPATADEGPNLSEELVDEQGRQRTGDWSRGRRGDDLGPPLVPPEER